MLCARREQVGYTVTETGLDDSEIAVKIDGRRIALSEVQLLRYYFINRGNTFH